MATQGSAGVKLIAGLATAAGAVVVGRELVRRRARARLAAKDEVARVGAAAVTGATGSTTTGVSRQFDPVFRAHSRGLPIAYLRALAKRESGMNPRLAEPRSGWGLMQVIEEVRRDYNERFATGYSKDELLEPEVSVIIATDLLVRIVAGYERNHPQVPNLQWDWDNPRYVELLTFGWNAGYSEKGGVGRVARYLEDRGVTDITIDTVHANAGAAGASRHLERADKVSWCKSVALLYFAEKARDERELAGQTVS